MSQGLQCWDAYGKLTLNVTDRLTRVLGEFNTGKISGTIIDPNLAGGIPWYVAVDVGGTSGLYSSFKITFTPNSLSWEFGSSGEVVPKNCVYGVY